MRVRKSKLSVALASLMLTSSATVYALGLGEIDVQSGLNQPLNAEIKLLSVNQAELDALKVSLADANAYTLAGLDRPALLSQIEFQVAEKNGHHVIHLTTKQPVKEPFLDFIIEVNWPAGRLLREYTLLLDPPVFAEQAPAIDVKPAEAAKPEQLAQPSEPITLKPVTPAAPIQQQPNPDNNSESAAKPKDSRQAGNNSPASDTYGPTEKNDQLWSLAKKLRPDTSISIEQMMVALFQTNPDAFYDNNLNNLKAGYVLRMPDRETILKLDQETAAREARMQYQRWAEQRKATTVAEQTSDAPALAVRNDGELQAPDKEKSRSSSGQLKLIAPEGEGAAGAGGSEKATPKDVEGLQRELQLTMEAAAASEQEKAELKSRIAALEEQLASMQRLIVLKDDTLGELQGKLGQQAGVPQAPTDNDAAQVAVDVGTATPQSANTNNQQQVKPPEPTPEKGILQWLLSNPIMLGVILIISGLLAALTWVAIRRRQNNNDEEFQEFLAQNSDVTNLDERAKALAIAPKAKSPHPVANNPNTGANSGLNITETEDANIDPLAEADVYLAYRRYQQAEDLIREAISREPQRDDLQLKLLEIYYAVGNKTSFEAQAESLYVLWSGDNNPKWTKVAEMGRELCPDNPLFNGEISTAEEVHLDSAYEVESLFSDYEESPSTKAASMPATSKPTLAKFAETHNTAGSAMFADTNGHPDNVIEFESGLSATNAKRPRSAAKNPAPQIEPDAGHTVDFDFDLDSGSDGAKRISEENLIPPELERALESAADSDIFKSIDSAFLDDEVPAFAATKETAITQQKPKVESERGIDLTPADNESIDIEFNFDDALFDHDEHQLFANGDVISTKLDLARAYIDMDDSDGARSILGEVLEEGNEIQKEEARQLIRQIG